MPSLDDYKKYLAYGQTGIYHKSISDSIMESTWDNDIQSKVAYIYDYYHDNQPEKSYNMTYDNTTKTQIDIKFIVTQYQTLNKDTVEYHIQFKPSQPLYFQNGDELYYYETDYRNKYGSEFPIGLYIDIPNENGVYEKWLICGKESQNQFPKYSILRCNYEYMWISEENGKRIKNKIFAVCRSQSSYNSGLWSSNSYTRVENQEKAIFPINKMTEYLNYTHPESKQNQRMIVSALILHPSTWQISKVESHNPLGLLKLTLFQTPFNEDTDYVNLQTNEMYADYYYGTRPYEDEYTGDVSCIINATVNNIRVGGTYKTLTAKFYDNTKSDITEVMMKYLTLSCWKVYLENEDITNTDLVSILEQKDANKIKVKFCGDRNMVTKCLTIVCEIHGISGKLDLEILSL